MKKVKGFEYLRKALYIYMDDFSFKCASSEGAALTMDAGRREKKEAKMRSFSLISHLKDDTVEGERCVA